MSPVVGSCDLPMSPGAPVLPTSAGDGLGDSFLSAADSALSAAGAAATSFFFGFSVTSGVEDFGFFLFV